MDITKFITLCTWDRVKRVWRAPGALGVMHGVMGGMQVVGHTPLSGLLYTSSQCSDELAEFGVTTPVEGAMRGRGSTPS